MPGRFNTRGRGGRQKPPRYSNTQVQQPLSQNMSQSQASQVLFATINAILNKWVFFLHFVIE